MLEFENISKLRSYEASLKQTQHDRVSSRTIRKWHLNMLIHAAVGESVADFIQGRVATTVGSAIA